MFGLGKGKIEIILEKYNFRPGETIKGKLSLTLKKPIKARQLRVEFVGLKTSTSTGFGVVQRNRKGSSQDYVHKFEMPLDGEKEYSGGEYSFEIAIPADILQRGTGPGGGIGKTLQAAQFLSGTLTRISWYVQAALDIEKGMDVTKKVQVNLA
ncbi:MAG: hypothetical protein ABIE23_02870 [archaeon]